MLMWSVRSISGIAAQLPHEDALAQFKDGVSAVYLRAAANNNNNVKPGHVFEI